MNIVKIQTMQRHSWQKGFTLIELMVVLVIMGILAALIVPNVMNRADQARVTAAKTDVGNLVAALNLYKLDNQSYPNTQQGLAALVAKPSAPPIPGNWHSYLSKLPADPWGHSYQYLNPGVHGEIDVFSYGPDGNTTGAQNSSEIGNWQ
jgi:general secretion pathway protein G